MTSLAEKFDAEVWRIHRKATCCVPSYDGRWFEAELRRTDGVSTTKKILEATEVQSGFTDMIIAGHPELTVEYLVCMPEWQPLFEGSHIREAQRRLGKDHDELA